MERTNGSDLKEMDVCECAKKNLHWTRSPVVSGSGGGVIYKHKQKLVFH